MIAFTVYGKPQPGGSKRAFFNKRTGRSQIVDANKNAKPWQAAVSFAAAQAYQGELLSGPLLVRFRFYIPRIKGHYGTGRNASVLRGDAPPYHIVKPDTLKLTRAAEDAMTGIIYRDDAQIVDEILSKRYGEPARMEVEIEEVIA